MSLSRRLSCRSVLVSSLVLGLCGCGGGTGSSESATGLDNVAQSELTLEGGFKDLGEASDLPAASIGGPGDASPQPGTPEWVIAEIKQLRSQKFADDIAGDVEKLKAARAERNQEIAKLATEAIALTHQDAAQEAPFTEAVHLLMEARLQLALQGDQESINALYEDASSLYERDAKSKAAAEAAYVLVRFAHTNARRFARQEPQWSAV